MPTVPDIHQRGTRAAQPAATAVTVGTLYFVSDEGVTERSTGSAWESYSGAAGGAGDVIGPASAIDDRIATFDGVTGKLIQDGGQTIAEVLTAAAAALPPRIGAVGIVIDGGGSVITTGVKGFVEVPFAGTITAVTLLSTDAAATAGSIVMDIWKAVYAGYPPTVANTITASAKPTLSAANKSRDMTLTGWTTAIAAGDVLGFTVDSVTTLTRVALSLTVQAG